MLNITPYLRGLLIGEMQHYTNIDAYITDMAQAYAWGDDPDAVDQAIPVERIKYLTDLWDWWHMSAAELLQASGYTAPQLSHTFGVPYSTLAGWVSGKAKAPQYIIAMAAELLELRRARA
nr:MAG TPA: protein-turn-helix DNA binding protein [Caudoviricetes sp.]